VAAGVLLAGPAAARPAKAAPTCGSVITKDTKLKTDLTCDGPALVLRRGVTLDLRGHSVTGRGPDATTGILVTGPATTRPTVIRGGTIAQWHDGVMTEPYNDIRGQVTLSDVTIRRAPITTTTTDILVRSSRLTDSDLQTYGGTTTVVDSRLVRSSAMRESTWFRLERSTVIGGQWGGDENQQVEIIDSVLDGRGTVGRPPSTCSGTVCRISGSTIRNYTVPLAPWYTATITDTTFVDNPGGAVLVGLQTTATITGSRFIRDGINSSPAITVYGRLSVLDSAFTGSGGGVHVTSYAPEGGVSVRRSTFRDHQGNGISSESPGVRLGDNTAVGNAGWGIYAPGAVDEGGNVARGNGTGQCFGVTCAPR
jgi:hypothetical protein